AVDMDEQRLDPLVLGDVVETIEKVPILDQNARDFDPGDIVGQAACRQPVATGVLQSSDHGTHDDQNGQRAPKNQPAPEAPAVDDSVGFEAHDPQAPL